MAIKEQLKKYGQIKKNWKTILSFFFKYNDKAVIALFVVSGVSALTGVAFTYLLSQFVNEAGSLLTGEQGTALWLLGGILGLAIMAYLAMTLRSALTRKVIADSTERIQGEAITFACSDDYLHFISKEQKDKHLFLMNVSNSTNRAILNGVTGFISGFFTILGGIGILFSVSGWASLVMTVLMIISCLYVENNNGRKLMELFGNTIMESRKLNYFTELLTGNGYACEKSLFGYSEQMHERMKQVNDEIVSQKEKTTKRISRNTMLFRLFYSFTYFIFVLCVFLSGNIHDAGTIFLAFSMTKSIVQAATAVGKSLSNTYIQAGYIEKFNDYLAKGTTSQASHVSKTEAALPQPSQDDVIAVRNLTFRYYENAPVLQDVSFTIRKGETVAIVGENGAGKTTLANVLLGLLYSGGSVLVNGVDPYEDLMAQKKESGIVSVMQNFGRYNGISLKDNITFGEPLSEELQKRVEAIFGENKDQTPESIMGNEFGGIGASGGQWQKLALLRGQRKQGIVLLDEPTASLDPRSEATILREFMTESAGENTKLIITHRLGCTKYADRILVLDHGTIAENGSFDELMARKGKYHEMYTAQAELYQIS